MTHYFSTSTTTRWVLEDLLQRAQCKFVVTLDVTSTILRMSYFYSVDHIAATIWLVTHQGRNLLSTMSCS